MLSEASVANINRSSGFPSNMLRFMIFGWESHNRNLAVKEMSYQDNFPGYLLNLNILKHTLIHVIYDI